jgi:hypothetical protein
MNFATAGSSGSGAGAGAGLSAMSAPQMSSITKSDCREREEREACENKRERRERRGTHQEKIVGFPMGMYNADMKGPNGLKGCLEKKVGFKRQR